MAKIYAELIKKGRKTINEVPELIREQVKEALIGMGLPELVGGVAEEVADETGIAS